MPQLSAIREETYWMSPHPITKSYSNQQLPKKTDVLVIGSGYTGVVAALQLRKAGMHVTLIDKTKIGSEASAKNGGMALNGLATSLYKVKKKYGQDEMVRFFQESLESINCVERLVKEGNIDCHFRRSGYFEAAFKPSHFEGLKGDQEFLAQHLNHTTILIPPERLHEEIASDLYHGGLVDPISAGVHPAKYIAGLVRMADEAGVNLYEQVEALEITPAGGKSIVRTNQGQIEAQQVVVGTNGYTTNLTPWQMRRVVPVESFMIATEELPPELSKTLIPNDRMIFDTKRFLFYFRLSPDGKRVLFGGRPKHSSMTTLEKARTMRRDMLGVFPQLEKYAIDYTWFGKVGFTVNRFPLVGERHGVHYAIGYCGHGVGMATYFGFKLAEMILGKGEQTAFSKISHLPIPMYFGNPWFLPIAHQYFRFLDKVQ